MNIFLLGTCGTHNNQTIPIDDEIIMGRDTSLCQLVFPTSEKAISGVHCKIQNIDGTIQLTDMGSTNGTFLDTGVRLVPHVPQILLDGQGFYLGDKSNSFQIQMEAVGKQCDSNRELQHNSHAEQRENQKEAQKEPQKESSGIGISIATLAAGIISVIVGIAAIFLDSVFWFAFIFGIIGMGLGILSLAMKCKGKAMSISGTLFASIVTVAIIGSIIYEALSPQTLAGSWTCTTVNNEFGGFSDAVTAALHDAGVEWTVIDKFVDFAFPDETVFVFSDSGELYFTDEFGNGVDIYNSIIWEDLGGSLLLTYELSEFDIEIKGFKIHIPKIKIAHNAKYEIQGDTMTIDFFGTEMGLERVY